MAISAINVAKELLQSLTKNQQDLHTILANDNNIIITPFYKKFIKCTWRTSVLMKLDTVVDGNDVLYNVNTSFHFLEYTYMCAKLPLVKIKNEWRGGRNSSGKARIAWCHNIGNNMRLRGIFKDDDQHNEYNTRDNVWGDIEPQFFQKGGAGGREGYNLGAGNVSHVEEWTEDFLPPYDIDIDQNFFYSLDPANAYPIWPKGSQTRAGHRFTYRRKIVNLLRVELLDEEGNWVAQKTNLHKYIDMPASGMIKIPQLWGRYSYVGDNEIEWYKTCDDTWVTIDEEKNIKQKTMYIKDVVSCDIKNPVKYGTISDTHITCRDPCLAFFWVAENRDATLIHNYSNYTTNTNNIYEGWDPIKKTTFKIGTYNLFKNMDSHHFSLAQPRRHSDSIPWIQGYHCYYNASDNNDYIGVVYDDLSANLHCKIANTDIYLNKQGIINDDDDEDDDDETEMEASEIIENKNNNNSDNNSPSFIVRTRLLVLRKLVITTKEDGGYSFEIK